MKKLESCFSLLLSLLKINQSYQSYLRCIEKPGLAGRCLNDQTKWTFVKKFGCYSFQYSGCGGNGNNFETKHECSKLCMGKAAFNSTSELNDKQAMDKELHQMAQTNNQPLINNIEGVSSSMIHGGAMVTDPGHYPWFVFIKIGMPDIQWLIYDPKTWRTSTLVMDEKNPEVWGCSGILVTLTRVLTADHCLWLEKPLHWTFNEPGEKGKLVKEIEFYKNVVTDTSIRFLKTRQRGTLDNIAVKLYGTNYADAHPNTRDEIQAGVMFHPWFGNSGKDYAFKVKSYHAIQGGVNVDGLGDTTANSVDLAVLTVFTRTFFDKIGFPMDYHLTRLKWVEKDKDKLTEKKIHIYTLGAGKTEEDSKRSNEEQQLYLSKNKSRYKSFKDCLKKDPNLKDLLNVNWSICIKEGKKMYTLYGDSGGPGLVKDKSGPKDKHKAVYFLHYIVSGSSEKISVHTTLEQKKNIVLPE